MNSDNTSVSAGKQNGLWVERATLAATHAEDVPPGELEQWLKDSEFVEAYRAAMRTKGVVLGSNIDVDVDEAFQEFKSQNVSPLRAPRSKFIWLGVAAAACAAMLIYFSHPSKLSETGLPGAEAYLYQADPNADTAVVLAMASDTLRLTAAGLSEQQSAAKSQPKTQNPVSLQPIDYSQYQITRSTLIVPQGKAARLELPDGTLVWLNACSSLIYPTEFKDGEPRSVQLKGEAYFAVARDGSRPFIVDCGGVQTRVLGTEFNIRNYAGGQPCVTLVSGSVEVSSDGHQVKLQPGQQVTISSTGAMSIDSDVDLETVTCWRDNRFYFDGQTLRDIMTEVGRWYNMDVMIGSNSHLDDRLHFRGERQWTIQQVVEQMNMISNAEILIEGNTLTVF